MILQNNSLREEIGEYRNEIQRLNNNNDFLEKSYANQMEELKQKMQADFDMQIEQIATSHRKEMVDFEIQLCDMKSQLEYKVKEIGDLQLKNDEL